MAELSHPRDSQDDSTTDGLRTDGLGDPERASSGEQSASREAHAGIVAHASDPRDGTRAGVRRGSVFRERPQTAPSKAIPAPQDDRSRTSTAERARVLPIRTLGRRLAIHEDLYHWVLTLTWRWFFAIFLALFLALNVGFAGVYRLHPMGVHNAETFLDFFFFSVETMATIGYGDMSPNGVFAHVVMTFEAVFGIGISALMTGLLFARFARPTAKVRFAHKAVITPYNGVPHLMFRMANWRRNQIVDAKLDVALLITEVTREGDLIRRPVVLDLVRTRNPMFAWTWTVMHPIDERSPFFGSDAFEKLRGQHGQIFLSLSGIDETIMQPIHARFRYELHDIEPNAKFVDVLTLDEHGQRTVDFGRLNDIVANDAI